MYVDEAFILSSLASRDELDRRSRAQAETLAAIKNRVETLERENADLHRMLDEQTDKALEILSSSKSQAAKFEEEREKDRADLQATRSRLAAAETQMASMKERLHNYLAEELQECVLADEREAQLAASTAATANQSQSPGTV
jgi:predicted RNase H-like nuclease (RuvC/YqgF family)